jgi:hypothetical protein
MGTYGLTRAEGPMLTKKPQLEEEMFQRHYAGHVTSLTHLSD